MTSYYKSIKILPFLDKYISWILKLSPALGAILMSVSTVIVAINAMLLRLDPKNNG